MAGNCERTAVVASVRRHFAYRYILMRPNTSGSFCFFHQESSTGAPDTLRSWCEDSDLHVLLLIHDLRDQQEEVGVAGFLAGGGQHRMHLSAMMRLGIEEMSHQQLMWGADLAVCGAAEPSQVL